MKINSINSTSFTSRNGITANETRKLIRKNLTHPYYKNLPQEMTGTNIFQRFCNFFKNIIK